MLIYLPDEYYFQVGNFVDTFLPEEYTAAVLMGIDVT